MKETSLDRERKIANEECAMKSVLWETGAQSQWRTLRDSVGHVPQSFPT